MRRSAPLCILFVLALTPVAAESPWEGPFDLRLVWERELGSGYSGISVSDGIVATLYSDGVNDRVGVFDAASGRERWTHSLGPTYPGRHGSENGPSSTPLISADRIFVTGPDALLVALDLATGTELWSVGLVEAHGARVPWYGFGASPIMTGDALFVPFGTRDGRSGMAFDPETGEPLWTLRGGWVDYQNPVRVDALPGPLSIDTAALRSFDPKTGKVAFEFTHRPGARDLAYPLAAPIGRDRLLLLYQDRASLYSVDPDREPPLTEVWHSTELKDSYAIPGEHDGAIFGLSGIFLVAVDTATGERLWKSREPGARGMILVGDHLVLFATNGDVVIATATRDGYDEKARVRAAERGGFTSPTFAAGRVYVRNTSSIAAVAIHTASRGKSAGGMSVDTPKGEFAALIDRSRRSERPGQVIDAWWKEKKSVPFIDGDQVVFVFRGVAEDVAVIGDMTEDRNVPEAMRRVPGTDLFYRSYPYTEGSRWQYSFLVDLEHALPDPLNSHHASPVVEIGGNPRSLGYPDPEVESVLELPGWEDPIHLKPGESAAGRIEQVPFESNEASTRRELQVYLPIRYDEGGAYPTLYVLGGHGWLEHGNARTALDRLMGRRCAEAIAVFVPYHSGSRDRMGGDDYARMVQRDILPVIEERYRTNGTRAVLGAADDAAAALILAFTAPEIFQRFSVQSPYLDPEDIKLVAAAPSNPTVGFMEWSRYEPRILDEHVDERAGARAIHELVAGRGVHVVGGEIAAGPGWGSWAARLDRVLETLLPRASEQTRVADPTGP